MPEMPEMVEVTGVTEVTPSDRILSLYAALAGVTGQMLAAARAEDWDALVPLEANCAAKVQALQRNEAGTVLSDKQGKKKTALLAQMLADDEDIRPLVAARMTQLSQQMNSTSTERKLSRAYGA